MAGETAIIKDLIKSEALFTFELEGKSEIDAKTLSQILSSTVAIIEEMVKNEPEAYVNLKITKFSTGSFDIDFQAVAEQAVTILADPKSLASYLVGGVVGAFKIAKHVKGEKPRSIIKNNENTDIVNSEGESISVLTKTADSYFCNNTIENQVIHIVNIVSEETDRPGFRIKGKDDGVTVEYKKEDFSSIKPIVDEMVEVKKEVFVNRVPAILIIRKPDLTGDSKWGFIFEKNIEATIEDKDWLAKIRAEKFKFGPNMRVPVVLRLEVDMDECGDTIKGSERYAIEKVTGDIFEPEEMHQHEFQ